MIFDEGLVKLWTVRAFIQRDRSYQLSIYTDRLQPLRPRVNSNRSWATRTQESTRPIVVRSRGHLPYAGIYLSICLLFSSESTSNINYAHTHPRDDRWRPRSARTAARDDLCTRNVHRETRMPMTE